jgi:hypothetical protein
MARMTPLPGMRNHQGLSLRMSDATILCTANAVSQSEVAHQDVGEVVDTHPGHTELAYTPKWLYRRVNSLAKRACL